MINCRKCNKEYDDSETYCQQCNISLTEELLNSTNTSPSFAGLLAFLIVCFILSIALVLSYWLYGALFWTVIGAVLASGMVKVKSKDNVTFYTIIKWTFITLTVLVLCLIGVDYFMAPIPI